ncbi:hypothetical protein HAX54_010111 [Datura stramonium]|uniref:Uncharacterized protein n=1 Tax=Datura stramonium TaxID=4076 RepID=A0ABS8X0R6_DATST|nr:hypothetical protein [Datura stramonium]
MYCRSVPENYMVLLLFLNSERAVVALFIARIIFSVPQPLLFESLSLSLISLLALLVEIAVDQSSPSSIYKFFKTSPGASSGDIFGGSDTARAYGVKVDLDSKSSIVK